MEQERLDLSPLDPSADAARWERLVGSIMRRAAPQLARRGMAPRGLFAAIEMAIAGLSRPLLAAGLALAVLSAAALALTAAGVETPLYAGPGVEEELELDAPVSLWLLEGRAPSTSDLLLAVEGAMP